MVPKGLLIAVIVGVIAGFILGIIVVNHKGDGEIEFVMGPSLFIGTDKTDYQLGEKITIKIINSGSVPLEFSDASYGMKITGLDGTLMYSPVTSQVISILEPREEIVFVWDQIKNDGDTILEGRYKIVSETIAGDGKIKKSITVNVLK